MQFNFEMNSLNQQLRDRGLQDYGQVQKFIDQECIRHMTPYTPMLNGMLTKTATLGTRIGSGDIKQIAPYARYQYYGKLMVSSLTGSSYSKGESKELTDVDLQYSKHQHPMAGPMWFERMKADKKEQILRGAEKVAGG
jgi:hypothetical protein